MGAQQDPEKPRDRTSLILWRLKGETGERYRMMVMTHVTMSVVMAER
jgi:hypothetical protein